MTEPDRRDRGRVFNEVPELYDRVRPAYPDELFADLVAISGMHRRSQVLEVGCGTGQAARSRRHEAGHEAVPVGLVAARPVLPAARDTPASRAAAMMLHPRLRNSMNR